MNTDDWQGNVSTILKFAYMLLAPYIAEILTEDQFTVIGVAVVGLIIAIWDAYNPNTFKIFKNNKNKVEWWWWLLVMKSLELWVQSSVVIVSRNALHSVNSNLLRIIVWISSLLLIWNMRDKFHIFTYIVFAFQEYWLFLSFSWKAIFFYFFHYCCSTFSSCFTTFSYNFIIFFLFLPFSHHFLLLHLH